VESAKPDARFNVISIGIGGMGARPDKAADHHVPERRRRDSVEITEKQVAAAIPPARIRRGSAGFGRRGKAARRSKSKTPKPALRIACAAFDRRHNPARGRAGGGGRWAA
jgi:hypothetical protein